MSLKTRRNFEIHSVFFSFKTTNPVKAINTSVLFFSFQAPETGQYIFYVAGDDQCRLSISTDDDPKNLRQIVKFRNGLYTRPDQWEKYV